MKRNIKNIKGRKLGFKKKGDGNNKKRMSLRKEKKRNQRQFSGREES